MPLTEDGGHKESAVYDTVPPFDPYNPDPPPADPESVQPTSLGPAPSSETAPGFGDTSGADGEPQEEPQDQPEKKQDPLPEFDPKHRQPFEGLLYLGRLQERFTLWGHAFVIHTLTTEQIAEIGQIVRPHEGSPSRNAVYQAAFVAAALVTVDGQELPRSIMVDNNDELTTVRFPYVMRNYMPPVREALYNRAFALELVARQVLAEMGKASG